MDNPATLPEEQQPTALKPATLPQPDESVAAIPDAVAQSRATKATYGLTDITGKQYHDYYGFITAGLEPDARKEAASKVDDLNLGQYYKRIQQVAQTDANLIPTVSYPDKSDPTQIFEQAFANKITRHYTDMTKPWQATSDIKDAMQEDPEGTEQIRQIGAGIIAKREALQKTVEDLQSEVSRQSWVGWTADQAKLLFQPYSELKLRGNVEGTSFFKGLLGSNLQEQGDRINDGWPATKPEFDAIIERLKQDNPTVALTFANYVLGVSTSQEGMDNLFTVQGMVDAGVSLKPAFSLAGKAAGAFGKRAPAKAFVQATKNVVEGSADIGAPPTTLEDKVNGPIKQPARVVAEGVTGNQEGAAVAKEANNAIKFVTGQSDPEVEAIEGLPSYLKVDERLERMNPGYYGREIISRISENRKTFLKSFFDAIYSTLRVDRTLTNFWTEEQFKKVAAAIGGKYPTLASNLHNIQGPYRGQLSNAWYVSFIIGDKDGKFWNTFDDALREAGGLKIPIQRTEVADLKAGGMHIFAPQNKKITPGATIERDGNGYYIRKMVPIREIDDVVRDALAETSVSEVPKDWTGGYIDALIGRIGRTPDETQSLGQRFNRKVATTAPPNFLEWAQGRIKELKNISPAGSFTNMFSLKGRKQWGRFKRALEFSQTQWDKDLNKQGRFFRDPGELEQWYQSTYKDGLPSQDFIAAYWEFKNIIEADRWFRIVSLVRNKLRLGTQAHTIHVLDPEGKALTSEPFEGIRTTDKISGEGTTLVVGSKANTAELIDPSNIGHLKVLSHVNEMIESGEASHTRIYDPESAPLKKFLEQVGLDATARIQHVVAVDMRERPLDWSAQLTRTGGGHLEPDHPWYLKWAKVHWDNIAKKYWYHGDGTFAAGNNRAELEGFAKHINTIHDFMDKKDYAGAEAYHTSTNLPIPWKKLKADYFPSKNPITGEIIPARLNPKEKLQVVPAGKMIIDNAEGRQGLNDRYGDSFRDGTTQGSPARQNQIQFTGERDVYELNSVQDRGSLYNPLYDLTPAKFIDPISMMNRGLRRIVNSLFMDDYKMSAVEHWLFGPSGAAKYIDAGPHSLERIKHSPYFWFNNPKWIRDTPITVKERLEADAWKIKQFLGTPSAVDNYLDSAAEKMADSVYGKFGPKGLKYVPTWMLPHMSDGPMYLRNALYHMKMGFFNPRQFFLHFFTIMNGALMAGADASLRGGTAALMHMYSSVNSHPNVLSHIDFVMSKLGWRPGEWKEAQEGMFRTGWNNIDEGRMAMQDNPLSFNILSNWTQNFLHAGMLPFRGGVKSLRTFAWYTAYHEFRKLNPVGKVGDKELQQILERADILSHNMTRASSSSVQKGFTTFGAQFVSYNLRMLELVSGKRLTKAERIRLLFGYGALLGVPTAGAIFGLSTFIRQEAQKQGYVPGQNIVATAFMEGLLPLALYEATGHVYNIGESYGAKDLDIVDKALENDATIYEILGGAAYSTGASIIKNGNGYWQAMLSMIRKDGKFSLTAEDYLDPFKEISTLNYATRAYYGIKYGQIISRNGAYLGDTSWQNALGTGVFGVTEQQFADIYTKSLSVKEWQEQEKQNFYQYARTMQRYYRALADKDYDNADKYGKQAAVYLEYMPWERRKQAMATVARDNQSLRDRVDWNYYVGKDVPDTQRQDKLDTYQKIQGGVR